MRSRNSAPPPRAARPPGPSKSCAPPIPARPLPDRTAWKLTASLNAKDLQKATDGDAATRWSTNTFQKPGQWLPIELPAETEVAGLELDKVEHIQAAWPATLATTAELSGSGQ
ncbi:MAG TPA: hypothetical protein VD994_18915 [Prosthecobacter sp.]|nr:hypothetical protein [Prosthecobacter sp.]